MSDLWSERAQLYRESAAHRDGVVTALSVAVGQLVETGQVICVVEAGG